MHVNLHANARTTPAIRRELQTSKEPTKVLAERYNLHPATVRKWRSRSETTDGSHRPHRLDTRLSPDQETLVVELRQTLFLPLDDLLAVTREFIQPHVSRSGLDRCLRRHGVANLHALMAAAESQAQETGSPPKAFKTYPPGYVHIDVKYLPQMADQTQRSYLFCAIDRSSRWFFAEIFEDKSAASAQRFLSHLIEKASFPITHVLTDNGTEFTDRFIATGSRQPTGHHPFDQLCYAHGIDHRLIPPRHPQTNGMVERFNRRVNEVIARTHFASAAQLHETVLHYINVYNQAIPQRSLGHRSPIQTLQQWQADRPELFHKGVDNHPGLDIFNPVLFVAGLRGRVVVRPLGPSPSQVCCTVRIRGASWASQLSVRS
jgi:transposase InsO family protein